MAEVLVEKLGRLEFEILSPGDKVAITTGHGSEEWRYDFNVSDISGWITGSFQVRSPAGEISESVEFELHGCGFWTDRKQNPVQEQDKAFTPYYDGLIVGCYLLGKFVGGPDRIVFDKPGQEISAIERTPFLENTILQALAGQAGALSVRQLVDITNANVFKLGESDIRTTLARLVTTGLVTQYKKKVLQFTLTENV